MDPLSPDSIDALAKQALDDSVEHLDAYTLSRLNQARQQALEYSAQPRSWAMQRWLPAATAGSLAAALLVALLLPGEQPTEAGNQFAAIVEAEPTLVVMEDPELLEDLDMMLWLLDEESHAS